MDELVDDLLLPVAARGDGFAVTAHQGAYLARGDETRARGGRCGTVRGSPRPGRTGPMGPYLGHQAPRCATQIGEGVVEDAHQDRLFALVVPCRSRGTETPLGGGRRSGASWCRDSRPPAVRRRPRRGSGQQSGSIAASCRDRWASRRSSSWDGRVAESSRRGGGEDCTGPAASRTTRRFLPGA